MSRPPQKRGRDLVVGDVCKWGGVCRTTTHFKEHPGLDGDTARVVCSGDWGITTFDDDLLKQLSNGVWVLAHSWFDEQRKLDKKNAETQAVHPRGWDKV